MARALIRHLDVLDTQVEDSSPAIKATTLCQLHANSATLESTVTRPLW
ncbi:hypothetical protein ACQPXH_09030 [Nocardia sp. CA-135953]